MYDTEFDQLIALITKLKTTLDVLKLQNEKLKQEVDRLTVIKAYHEKTAGIGKIESDSEFSDHISVTKN